MRKIYFYNYIFKQGIFLYFLHEININKTLTATLKLVFSPITVFLHVAQQIGRYAFAVQTPKHPWTACCRGRRSTSYRFSDYKKTKQ